MVSYSHHVERRRGEAESFSDVARLERDRRRLLFQTFGNQHHRLKGVRELVDELTDGVILGVTASSLQTRSTQLAQRQTRIG